MKTRLAISAAVAATTALGAWAVSDRLDIFNADGTFKSFMTDDITAITYIKAPGLETYKTMKVETARGAEEFDMDALTHFKFKPVDNEAFEIDAVNGEHASFIMLYNHNKPDDPNCIDPTKPYGWRGSAAGGPVFFLHTIEKGFDAKHRVVGKYTGKEYTLSPWFITISLGDDNKVYSIGVDCYTFTMPFEPVEMSLVTTERTTYVGRDFVGTYAGIRIKPGETTLQNNPETTLTVNLKPSGAYIIDNTDPNYQVSFSDHYDVPDDESTFSYIPQEEKEQKTEFDEKIRYAANGTFLGDGIMHVRVRDIIDGRPDFTKYFFAAKGKASFVMAAADNEAYKAIVQITPEGKSPRYWLTNEYGMTITEATAAYKTGASLADANVSVIFSYDGSEQMKYTRVNSGDPTIIFKGNEAGTYSDGTRTLKLNGFGDATLDGVEGTYTIEGSVVTLTCNGQQHQLTINVQNKTFTEEADEAWTGPMHYYLTTARGAFKTNGETSDNTIELYIDHTLTAAEKPGYAALSVSLKRHDGFSDQTVISSCQKYVYNAAASTITITNVLMGEGTTGYKYQNVVLKVSADKKTIWFDDSEFDRYYDYSRTGSYILTGTVNTLTTDEIVDTPSLEGKTFSAATKGKYLTSNEIDAKVKLAVGFDKTGATAEGRATLEVIATMGGDYEVVNDCVDYTFADGKLTLKNVTVGNGDMFSGATKTTDIVFTYANGKLTGDVVVYGNSTMTAPISVDLSKCELSE